VFKCAGERAFDLATAFGQAFSSYSLALKLVNGNPFQAVGPPNIEQLQWASTRLKRQVRRSELVADVAIGESFPPSG
jgi:hypothetical protein